MIDRTVRCELGKFIDANIELVRKNNVKSGLKNVDVIKTNYHIFI